MMTTYQASGTGYELWLIFMMQFIGYMNRTTVLFTYDYSNKDGNHTLWFTPFRPEQSYLSYNKSGYYCETRINSSGSLINGTWVWSDGQTCSYKNGKNYKIKLSKATIMRLTEKEVQRDLDDPLDISKGY